MLDKSIIGIVDNSDYVVFLHLLSKFSPRVLKFRLHLPLNFAYLFWFFWELTWHVLPQIRHQKWHFAICKLYQIFHLQFCRHPENLNSIFHRNLSYSASVTPVTRRRKTWFLYPFKISKITLCEEIDRYEILFVQYCYKTLYRFCILLFERTKNALKESQDFLYPYLPVRGRAKTKRIYHQTPFPLACQRSFWTLPYPDSDR